MIDSEDRYWLQCAIALAEEALEAGDEPFGSVLVSEKGEMLKKARNLVGGGDATQHPELALARWAADNLTPSARAKSVVYTSGEHCPMCAAAHALAGLGRIVYASSSRQLQSWLGEKSVSTPVKGLSINEVAPALEVDGPAEGLDQKVKALHERHAGRVTGTR